MDLINVLRKLGITKKEAKIYLAAVELGGSTVAKIAEKAGVNRVTTYSVLEKLMERGMLHSIMRASVRYFDAVEPNIIAHEWERRVQSLKKALPLFRRLRGEVNLPHVQYFEGISGIQSLYALTLQSKTEILNYANSREIRKFWPLYDSEYVAERVARKIFLRGIAPLDEYGLEVQRADRKNCREIRLVPAKKFTFTNEINIWDDKVAISSFRDTPPIGVLIESVEIANTQRDIFRMAWEYAGSLKKR